MATSESNFETLDAAVLADVHGGYSPELFSSGGVVVNSAIYRYDRYDPTNGTVRNGDLFRLSDFQMP